MKKKILFIFLFFVVVAIGGIAYSFSEGIIRNIGIAGSVAIGSFLAGKIFRK